MEAYNFSDVIVETGLDISFGAFQDSILTF